MTGSPVSSARTRRDGVLAIDAGTTGVTVMVLDDALTVCGHGYAEFPQHFPQSGWVEHDLDDIWRATLTAADAALAAATDVTVRAVGITNQRETLGVWDRDTLAAPVRAIVWQDRRTADVCHTLTIAGHGPRVADLTGLRLDPYFSATKLAWWGAHAPEVAAGIAAGRLAVGTIDSYLVARLTAGARHVTDASNASRTLLYDTAVMAWSEELADLFGVPLAGLPDVVPSWATPGDDRLGVTDPAAFCGLAVPIGGMAGDQQAALFGQACYTPGDTKCTYGTGSFVLTNTGTERVPSPLDGDGLLTTVAWQAPDGAVTYAREGSIFVTGAAVQWLRDSLQLIRTAADVEQLAQEAGADAGGVVFVPALTGLGAPHWAPDARGMVVGISRGTTKAHIARATLDSVCCQVRDVIEAAAHTPVVLRVDGGASANSLLMQLQADHVGVPVERPGITETTALGAAMLAGLGVGLWGSLEDVAGVWQLDRQFTPGEETARVAADTVYKRWQRAVELCGRW